MVHCNPAPPHPPPGEIYNVICVGRPYIDGFPVGYVMYTVLFLIPMLYLLYLQQTGSELRANNEDKA